MAISLIDTVTPDVGLKTGAEKMNSNFTDTENAASRLVGSQADRVPLNSDLGTAATADTGTAAGEVPLNSDLGTAAFEAITTLTWTATAPGETRGLFVTDTALYPPTDNPLFRYVILTEGQDGIGGYNDGVLINETISGSGVERQVTAEISLAGSPLNGTVVHLINSERSHLRPGETAGVFEQDQMQRITGTAPANWSNQDQGANGVGAMSSTVGGSGTGTNARAAAGSDNVTNINFNSANSPDARTSDTTDGETRVKSVSEIRFLRIA